MHKKIIHIDMDSFYASVEIRENPSLKGKPVAVGGPPHKRGVLSTCNYEARKYGVHSAMSSSKALQLCPELILVPGNMQRYKQISKQIHTIFQKYTQKIEPLSLDEAFLDVTDCPYFSGSATLIAEQIRKEIFETTKLTASAGVAPLKFLAKIASDENKPNGICVISPEKVDEFIRILPLKKIPGVGKVTNAKLEKLGFVTCDDVQKSEKIYFLEQFGAFGEKIWDYAHGIDERIVQTERKRKSVGVEITLRRDLEIIEQAEVVFEKLYIELCERLAKNGVEMEDIKTIGVKLKFSDFSTTTVEHIENTIAKEKFFELLQEAWERSYGLKIRLIGLKVGLFDTKDQGQLEMF